MSVEGEDGDTVFDRYNADLDRLGCGVRVGGATSRTPGIMAVVDLDGKWIADLPMTIDAEALAAVMLLVERTFEEGVETGRTLERAGR